MTTSTKPAARRRPGALGLVIAAILGASTAVGVFAGAPWYRNLIPVVLIGIIFIGITRRVYRPAITRNGDEILCRHMPLQESSFYLLVVALPLLGIAALGSAAHGQGWSRYIGYFLLCMGAIYAVAAMRLWLRARLLFRPSSLSVQGSFGSSPPVDIPRTDLRSITPRISDYNGVKSLRADLIYAPGGSVNGTEETVVIGSQFTVEPANLLAALEEWRNGSADEPGLMDRIERVLRGTDERSPAGPDGNRTDPS